MPEVKYVLSYIEDKPTQKLSLQLWCAEAIGRSVGRGGVYLHYDTQ